MGAVVSGMRLAGKVDGGWLPGGSGPGKMNQSMNRSYGTQVLQCLNVKVRFYQETLMVWLVFCLFLTE